MIASELRDPATRPEFILDQLAEEEDMVHFMELPLSVSSSKPVMPSFLSRVPFSCTHQQLQ